MRKITVIGSGTMGSGIAQIFALNGYKVSLYDLSLNNLDLAIEKIQNSLEKLEKKQLINNSMANDAISRIKLCNHLENSLKESELIIEVIVEDFSEKEKLLKEVNQFCLPDAIIASNTSSISITKLANKVSKPERFIGMHFMNPVPIMPLVEIINGMKTSKSTTDNIISITKSINKTPIVVNDYPGFVANRILMPMINEAIHTLNEGVGDVEAIDQIMKLGMSHPMGPLELADFIGLDVCLYIMNILYKELGNTKYAPCPLLVKLVDANHLGVKTQQGFYKYDAKKKEKQAINFKY
ncbi:MAG: 3-hydroxybutyryl-CoA dehydrogenase [Cytophagales bacterium]|nr:MAG: 3-hydroxybutyryl-CoA dehydrogenase [Cytophagales bacterium]